MSADAGSWSQRKRPARRAGLRCGAAPRPIRRGPADRILDLLVELRPGASRHDKRHHNSEQVDRPQVHGFHAGLPLVELRCQSCGDSAPVASPGGVIFFQRTPSPARAFTDVLRESWRGSLVGWAIWLLRLVRSSARRLSTSPQRERTVRLPECAGLSTRACRCASVQQCHRAPALR